MLHASNNLISAITNFHDLAIPLFLSTHLSWCFPSKGEGTAVPAQNHLINAKLHFLPECILLDHMRAIDFQKIL
jgi:hypothetical protein